MYPGSSYDFNFFDFAAHNCQQRVVNRIGVLPLAVQSGFQRVQAMYDAPPFVHGQIKLFLFHSEIPPMSPLYMEGIVSANVRICGV